MPAVVKMCYWTEITSLVIQNPVMNLVTYPTTMAKLSAALLFLIAKLLTDKRMLVWNTWLSVTKELDIPTMSRHGNSKVKLQQFCPNAHSCTSA